ncbi:hypothetical protein G7046_g8458 [Stylonectria norvegica]|nr:hypothetical protein G7046_g8458 [Stylonectria norvegica]
MAHSKNTSLLLIVASAISVAAHGHVDWLITNGVAYRGYDAPSMSWNPAHDPVVGWTIGATDNGYVEPNSFSDPDIICHKAAKPGKGHVTVQAGDKINLQWNTWPDSHKGPVIDYLAKCPGNCEDVDKTTLNFFKISAAGLLDMSLQSGRWADDVLISNGYSWTVQIPAQLEAGNYVLRHEIIALHGAGQPNGAQAYPQCFNLKVTGGGSLRPAGIKGTDLYKTGDPGILFNLYTSSLSYKIPGPTLVAGLSSSAPQAATQATVTSSATVPGQATSSSSTASSFGTSTSTLTSKSNSNVTGATALQTSTISTSNTKSKSTTSDAAIATVNNSSSHLLTFDARSSRIHPFSTSTMAPLPATMKAVQIHKNGGVETLQYEDVSVPKPAEGQVLVKNHFAGVNFIDTYFRAGLYPAPHFPLILGREGAGEVVDSHGSDIPTGSRVAFMGGVAAYAEYSVVAAKDIIVLPDSISTEQGAAAFLQGLTAWTFIREAGEVKAGQWVLVHAAAGGVGTLLVQMLRAVGAKTIGTASTEEKCALARKNGAGWTINSNDDIVAKVKEITEGHGVDVIFDGVGKSTFEADLEMIAVKGHLISFGNASGAVPPVNILRLGAKNVKLMRPVVGPYVSQRADLVKYTNELWEMIASKKIEIAVHEIYPLKEVARAHEAIEGRKTTGKLLIKCD